LPLNTLDAVNRAAAVIGLILFGFALTPAKAADPIKVPAKLIFPEVLDFNDPGCWRHKLPIEVEFTWPLESPVRLLLWIVDDRIKAGYNLKLIVKDSTGKEVSGIYPIEDPTVQ